MDQCFHPNAKGAQAIADAVVERARTMLPTPTTTQPTPAPPDDPPVVPPASGQGFHLPWEAGSVWQITSDNDGGNHADQWNQYAFDAVPVAGRGTSQVTAIADGTVVGFQADVPKSALFTQGHAGNCMMIQHADGTVSLYAHLAEGSIPGELRQNGATVRSGMVVGTVGDTGFAAGVHLHWSLLSEGLMYDSEGYRTCYGPSIPSQYADNDAELIEDGGVPRTGRYYASTNVVGSTPQAPPAGTDSTDCNDTGLPQLSEGLSISPASPDTATEVTFSFTITNTGCGTFLPEVLAIGGRDPSGAVTDPLQIRDFFLASGESRTITHSAVLSIPGSHEFFMAFLRRGGGWNRIADPSGSTASIYVTVSEAASTQADDAGTTQTDTESMSIIPVGPDGSVLGVGFTVTTQGGDYLGACTVPLDFPDGYIPNCSVEVPLDTIVAVWFDPASTTTTGLVPVEDPVYFDTSTVQDAQMWGPAFEFSSAEVQDDGGDPPPSTSGSDAVDIALITRDPVSGDLLTGTCYILPGASIEGCDRDGDGQVTFEAIAFGTHTVRQTQAPAGYPAINEFEIVVEGTGYMEAPSIAVPLGFIVKQAPEQNAPNTRNVSVVFLDMSTHERVTTGACVELIGASQVGCDRDLVDGQVDFLDVPAGGPYELSFSNLPPGAEVGLVGGPLAVHIAAGPDDPSNVMVFVLLAGGNGGGSDSGGAIEPTDDGGIEPTDDVAIEPDDDGVIQPDDGNSGDTSQGSATLELTLRGCPDGTDPNMVDPASTCTTPLDAPDLSRLAWNGGQGGMAMPGQNRDWDGTYTVTVPANTPISLVDFEPVVRNAFLALGIDGRDQNGDPVITLAEGATGHISIYYYNSSGMDAGDTTRNVPPGDSLLHASRHPDSNDLVAGNVPWGWHVSGRGRSLHARGPHHRPVHAGPGQLRGWPLASRP